MILESTVVRGWPWRSLCFRLHAKIPASAGIVSGMITAAADRLTGSAGGRKLTTKPATVYARLGVRTHIMPGD